MASLLDNLLASNLAGHMETVINNADSGQKKQDVTSDQFV